MTTPRDAQPEARRAALEYFWAQYKVWDETAAKHRKSISSWRLWVLSLGVAAAVLGALSDPRAFPWPAAWPTWGVPRTAFGAAAGVLLGLAAFLTRELLSPEREGRWLRARSAAEAFKREGYLLAAGVPPYEGAVTRALLDRGRGILAGVGDLQEESVAEGERLEGLPPCPLSADEYVALRLDEQISFYRRRAGEHRATVGLIRTLTVVLGVAAFVLGSFGGAAGVWLIVITTVTASLAAYLYANRLQYLVGSYLAAARNLDALRVGWQTFGGAGADAGERDRFILDCEAVLSSENQSWIAELARKDDGKR